VKEYNEAKEALNKALMSHTIYDQHRLFKPLPTTAAGLSVPLDTGLNKLLFMPPTSTIPSELVHLRYESVTK
jgi:hypothetical protein